MESGFGFCRDSINHIVQEIISIKKLGVEVAIVIGGGNIFRGNVADIWGVEYAEADNIGIIGTVINSLILRAEFGRISDYEVRVMTAVKMDAIAEPYIRLKAIRHMEKQYIVVVAAGIGQPYVTTDYPAVQRAIELRCDAILVAKNHVDGIFNEDPKKNKSAFMYKTLAYDDVVNKKIKIMDQSAVLLARDHSLPIHVFNISEKKAINRICKGETIGTYMSPETKTVIK